MKKALLGLAAAGILGILWAEGLPQWIGIQWMGAEALRTIPSTEIRHFYTPTTFTDIAGSVTIVAQAFPERSMSLPETILYVKTDNGAAKVDLGPSWFISSRGFKFTSGKSIRVHGVWMPSKSGLFLCATEVQTDGRTLRLRTPDGTPLWER